MKKRLIIFALLFSAIQLSAQVTKIYIVRHAEKSTLKPNDPDPELTDIGKVRASALADALAGKKIAAVFSTNYKRTRDTGAEVAKNNGQVIQLYHPSRPNSVRDSVLSKFVGKTVLIVGHSNTILEMAEAFGAVRPVKSLTEEDYDNLILVKINRGKVSSTIQKFGASNHAKN